MEIMYVDESGDPGRPRGGNAGNSAHYILSGIVIQIEKWQELGTILSTFRDYAFVTYGFPLDEEIHASELIRISKQRSYQVMKKRQRIEMLGDFIYQMPGMLSQRTRILNVCLRKSDFPEIENFQRMAWSRLIRGYEKYLSEKDSYGIILSDQNTDPTIQWVLEKMRPCYPKDAPYYYEDGQKYPQINRIAEDVGFRNSCHSLFIQAADAVAHCLYRREFPKTSLKKYNVDRFFGDLKELLYLNMNPEDPDGIVRN